MMLGSTNFGSEYENTATVINSEAQQAVPVTVALGDGIGP